MIKEDSLMPTIALLALEAADGTVVLTSITLVFAMLVALCLIITVEGKLFDALNNKKNPKPAPKKESKPAAAPAAKPAAPAPKTEGGIPSEIIAAISAAVATVVGGNAVIRGIKRIPKNGGSRRGAWGDAGVQEHTTPFM